MSLPVAESSPVRLVFLGAARVGKSALIHRFLHDRFEHRYVRTVEESHALEYDDDGSGPPVRLELLDTSGSYSFPAMRELRIRRGHAFALVYAVDDPGSLEEVRRLREEILELRGGWGGEGEGEVTPIITVVGNKAELTEREGRALPAAEVMAMVEQEWRAGFVEASARTGANAAGVFRALLRQASASSSSSSSSSSSFSRLSPPALRRCSDTSPRRTPRKRAPLRKNNSCSLS